MCNRVGTFFASNRERERRARKSDFDINTRKNTSQEIFEQRTIIDNFGNEQTVYVRSSLFVREETRNTNHNVKIQETWSPHVRQTPVSRTGRTAEQRSNIRIGVFTTLGFAAILVPTGIYLHKNKDRINNRHKSR
ncbi:MAG: hypothetical protein FWE23_05575 [Chitinivibrionia bacterium]|nr:hypothetical protein [Chitinivibrionia bacterium]